MAGACFQELAELLNPKPRFPDPEDHLVQKDHLIPHQEEQEEEQELVPPAARARTLLDTDPRYRGRKVTRKQLHGGEEEEEEKVERDDEDASEESEGEEQEEESGGDDDDDDEDDEDDEDQEYVEEEQEEGGAERVPGGVDFLKLTEGMDDLGVSEAEEEDSDEDDDEMEGSDEEEEEGDGSVRTFSKEEVKEEVQRGCAVQQQLALWDQLLEGRIKLQKVLVSANQLPQPLTFPEFQKRGGDELAAPLRTAHKALKGLQGALLQLQDQLLLEGAATRCILEEEEEEQQEEKEEEEQEAPRKRKLGLAEYPALMAKRFAAFRPFQDSVLQRWEDRTRLGGGFSSLQRGVLLQVQQVLEDPERLLRRTQTPRSQYKVLGKALAPPVDTPPDQEAEPQLQPNAHLKQLDEDVFDDDDFYHTLLRELIERRTSSSDPNQQVALGRQWLTIQKLRSKIKKKVDTKASKGRKVRFQVHSKLQHFMAPMDTGSMSHEARSELFRGLFSQGPAHYQGPAHSEATWTDVTTQG